MTHTEHGPSSISALLVMVHGSPRSTANADMYRVLEVVRQSGPYAIVQAAFLECNAPDIPTAIDRCVEQGATEIVAVPYFLHTGTHVAEDLPQLLEEGRLRHPNIDFRMGDYIGRSLRLTQILAARIRRTL